MTRLSETSRLQEESSGELQQRVKELEGECEQLLGRAEAAEATVRYLQVQHSSLVFLQPCTASSQRSDTTQHATQARMHLKLWGQPCCGGRLWSQPCCGDKAWSPASVCCPQCQAPVLDILTGGAAPKASVALHLRPW